jgi:hypothetical protein
MRKDFVRFVVVISGNLADAIGACSVWTKHDVTNLDSFGHGPKRAAGEACADTTFARVVGQKNRNEVLVKIPPGLREFFAQVLFDVEVGPDETAA